MKRYATLLPPYALLGFATCAVGEIADEGVLCEGEERHKTIGPGDEVTIRTVFGGCFSGSRYVGPLPNFPFPAGATSVGAAQ